MVGFKSKIKVWIVLASMGETKKVDEIRKNISDNILENKEPDVTINDIYKKAIKPAWIF